jgi:hypothetical protein
MSCGLIVAVVLLLLVCVCQVNLKLFAPEPNRRRTVLLFVIRDKSKTPMAKLAEILAEDVHKMWDSISKPPQYVDSKLEDFFEVGWDRAHSQQLHPQLALAAVCSRATGMQHWNHCK